MATGSASKTDRATGGLICFGFSAAVPTCRVIIQGHFGTLLSLAARVSLTRLPEWKSRTADSLWEFSLREKLIKIGTKIVSHVRYSAFQMAEVAVPRMLFAEILRLIAELRPPPGPAPA